jgi:hypothetical protein
MIQVLIDYSVHLGILIVFIHLVLHMKNLILPILFCLLGFTELRAQLPNGSVAPDFTVTDLNGNSINLYTLLDQGKTVYLDMFATWCGPCWNYKNTGAFNTLWNTYGPPGTNEAFVMAIECDAATNVACLYGTSGCVGGTQGNWVSGTDHPYVNDDNIGNLYNVGYYPTIYMVCPIGKTVWEVGQLNASALWAKRSQYCYPPPLVSTVESVTDVKCINTNTGAINISISGGLPPYTYLWTTGATTQDISLLAAGDYSCTVTAVNGATLTVGPITVAEPAEPLTNNLANQTPMGCNGVLASLTAEGQGGWGGYAYKWNNNATTQTISGLTPGNYTCTVTDSKGCPKSATFTVLPAIIPQAIVATPPPLTCILTQQTLNGSNSTGGQGITYLWTATNGGNIVSGANTTTPVINATGLYTLKVTDTGNNCANSVTVVVNANTTPPAANAGPPQTVTCTNNTTTLQGSGATGSNISYLWTASNGGNIVSGANTLTPTVNATGTYTLKVTNATNGCTGTASTTVGGTAAPIVNTTNGSITCLSTTVTLTTTTNANTPAFNWTGPNGYTSTEQNPVVNIAGDYTVAVTDPTTGCSSTNTALVVNNNNLPGATATGGSITCLNTSVQLAGSSADTTVTYAWTGPNNFSSSVANPTVSADGIYTLVVTNPSSGCTSAASAPVTLNNTLPAVAIAPPANLNCNNNQVLLDGTGSTQGATITYLWTTTNGNIVSGANTLTPVVNQAGTYALQISNTANGCAAAASASVIQSAAVVATIPSQTNIPCYGGQSGTATASGTGGNGNYTYLWSTGATTATLNNLTAGAYQVVITDGENCTASTTAIITQPVELAAALSATPQSANGVNDGTATALPTGGTAGYNYLWSNSATSQTITGLQPGIYTATITDANGCTAIQSVNVNAFNCTIDLDAASANVSCAGANNGTATTTISGANGNVTYAWSNGANTPTLTGLAAGTYSVTVVDETNCPASLNINITEPSSLNANIAVGNESAPGANNGSALANPVGGTAPYSFMWSNGVTTQSVANLAPGTYSLEITDNNGCVTTASFIVNPFVCATTASAISNNIACFGGNNGTAAVTVNNGAFPYVYSWSNNSTESSLTNLSAGVYTVTVVDANDCEAVASVTITEPSAYNPIATEVSNPVCPNDPTGMASLTITGATPPYNFLWSNGATGATVNNLVAATYTVTITDQNNCPLVQQIVLAPTDNTAPQISVQNTTVPLNANGIAFMTLNSLGATATDNCSIVSTSVVPSSFDCSELGSHTVSITATDAVGLSTTVTATVNIVDNTSPVVTCPSSITRCPYDDIVAYPAPVALDNCLLSAGGQWALLSGLPSGSEFPIGVTTQQYAFTDPSGNTGVCSFEVIITEPTVIENAIVINDIGNQGVGAISLILTGGVGPFTFEWTREGQVVGNTQNINNLTAGLYQVVVKDANGCTFLREGIQVSNTSRVSEPEWLSGMLIQPNPTTGLTTLIMPRPVNEKLEITILDQTGRALQRQVAGFETMITLDCTSLPAGLYTIRLNTNSGTGARKLVINR